MIWLKFEERAEEYNHLGKFSDDLMRVLQLWKKRLAKVEC